MSTLWLAPLYMAEMDDNNCHSGCEIWGRALDVPSDVACTSEGPLQSCCTASGQSVFAACRRTDLSRSITTSRNGFSPPGRQQPAHGRQARLQGPNGKTGTRAFGFHAVRCVRRPFARPICFPDFRHLSRRRPCFLCREERCGPESSACEEGTIFQGATPILNILLRLETAVGPPAGTRLREAPAMLQGLAGSPGPRPRRSR
jgi:hypothetical protein